MSQGRHGDGRHRAGRKSIVGVEHGSLSGRYVQQSGVETRPEYPQEEGAWGARERQRPEPALLLQSLSLCRLQTGEAGSWQIPA